MALKFTKSLLLLASIVWFSDACCPENWSRMGNKCYRFYGSPRRWNDALALCRNQPRGSLVSIHSYSEGNRIHQLWKSLVNNPTTEDAGYWIGLNDQRSEGNFVWSDGTSRNYVYWNSGEPNNHGGSEDCTHVRIKGRNDGDRMKWNDRPCDQAQAFFCQLPLDS